MKSFLIQTLLLVVTSLSFPLLAEEPARNSAGARMSDQEKPSAEDMEETRYLKAWQARTPPPPLDRQWIIKLWQEQDKPVPKQPLPPMAWKDDSQKKQCESYLPLLRESFAKARHYSIRGDSCRTAEHSRAFLAHYRQCAEDCPEKFLERNGYTPRIERNLDLLEELGQKRCVDIGSGRPAAPPKQNRPEKTVTSH